MMVSSLLSLYHAGGFAGSHATWREAVLDVPTARADGARGHLGKKNEKKVVRG